MNNITEELISDLKIEDTQQRLNSDYLIANYSEIIPTEPNQQILYLLKNDSEYLIPLSKLISQYKYYIVNDINNSNHMLLEEHLKTIMSFKYSKLIDVIQQIKYGNYGGSNK